jgi:hypothetical protein
MLLPQKMLCRTTCGCGLSFCELSFLLEARDAHTHLAVRRKDLGLLLDELLSRLHHNIT